MPEAAPFSERHATASQNPPGHEIRQPIMKRAHAKPHTSRPRSGSWGIHELRYYTDNSLNSHTSSRTKPTGLLSKLKKQNNDSSISTSNSTLTLPTLPESMHSRRPPLPLELVQSDRSTPHPSVSKSSLDKPLPHLHMPSPHASVSSEKYSKKKRTGIRSLGRFFRSLGKSSNTEQTTVGTTSAHSEAISGDTSACTEACQTFDAGNSSPVTTENSRHNVKGSGSTNISTTLRASAEVLQNAKAELAQPTADPSPRFFVRKCSTVDDLQLYNRRKTLALPRSRQSLPDMRQLLTHVKPVIEVNRTKSISDKATERKIGTGEHKNPFSKDDEENGNDGNEEEEVEDEDYDDLGDDSHAFDEDLNELGPIDAHDSRIAGDKLSKRLSGGHFGSAGGLIFSTLPLPIKPAHHLNNHEAKQQDISAAGKPKLSTISTEPKLHTFRDVSQDICSGAFNCDTSLHASPNTTTFENDENGDGDENADLMNIAADIARRIWEEDDSVYPDIEHIAEWIGNGKPSSRAILKHYLAHFDFTLMKLDEAFRRLCGKLYLKAEAQQIDRILEGFAERYWECNPQSVFSSPDVIHAIVYSLLLLNTDLHVAQGDHKKMTRSAFVRNTMNAVRAQFVQQQNNDDLDATLWEERGSNFTFHSTESRSIKRSPSSKSSASSKSNVRLPAVSLDITPKSPNHYGHWPAGSKAWQSEIENVLREIYSSIRNYKVCDPSPKDALETDTGKYTRRRSLQVTGSRVSAIKRNVGTIMWKTVRDSMFVHEAPETDSATIASMRSLTSTQSTFTRRRSASSLKSSFSHTSHLTHANSSTTSYQAVAPLLHNSEIPTSYTSAAPYYKEGLIVRKHLLERAGQKARHREWKECFMVVDRGHIRMYKFDGSNNADHRKSMARASMMISRVNLAEALTGRETTTDPATTVGGGDWMSNAQLIGEIDLKHTLSNALPSGYSRQRRHAFALQEPNGGVYLFQVGSMKQLLEWVSTCNYWAARESKEPLMGGVSSLEYGWGPCLEKVHAGHDKALSTEFASFPPVTIHEWKPPVPPLVSSAMEETDQLNALYKHVKELNVELDRHREIKELMESRFDPKTSYGMRAMTNWENKSQYLLHEIIKYQNYCDAIEKSLALQATAIQEEKEKQHMEAN